MSTTAPSRADADRLLDGREVGRIFVRHLTSLYIPSIALSFLLTGPHRWYEGLLFLIPMALAHQIDCGARVERRQPAEALPAWPFDLLVYTLAALQLWIVWETVQVFRVQSLFSVDMLFVHMIVGAASGFSIITAHELIHRKPAWEQGLGRLLLCTVLYEHFYTEHLRGHHVRVGTPEDPATAGFGEAFEPFFRRTVPAQWRSAWALEKRRLGDPDMSFLDPRMLKNRLIHGLLVEWGLAFAILWAFGFASFFAFVLQAFSAIRLLEAVNYFEHWGLQRRSRRVKPVDSWDTHSWFTYYGLTGLSRHADHHAWPSRPYQQLRIWEEAPILPYGYVGMVDEVMGRNADFQKAAAIELGRRRLGPFLLDEGAGARSGPVPEAEALETLEAAQRERAWLGGARKPGAVVRLVGSIRAGLRVLPVGARIAVIVLGLLFALTTGVQVETGAAEMGFAARFLLNGWILLLFVGMFPIRQRIEERIGSEIGSWILAVGAVVLLGLGTDALL